MASVLMCPHGGDVSAIPSGPRPLAAGVPLVLATDTFLVAGCPFLLGAVPSPCLTVLWIVPDIFSTVAGTPTLSQSSVGLCMSPALLPQGPVIVVDCQPQVTGS
ncbi:MAG TPA: hypothetical protein VMT95_12700 [Candidatus Binatia bacterium]|nr:hypothetical protein [Candidatus Binatia bacterium]